MSCIYPSSARILYMCYIETLSSKLLCNCFHSSPNMTRKIVCRYIHQNHNTRVCHIAHIIYQRTWQFIWPRLRTQVASAFFCLSLLNHLTSRMNPSHLAYVGTHPLVLAVMDFWRCHTCTPTSTLWRCQWIQHYGYASTTEVLLTLLSESKTSYIHV